MKSLFNMIYYREILLTFMKSNADYHNYLNVLSVIAA
jgi:hypothetical protein